MIMYLKMLTKHGLHASVQPNGKIRLKPDWLITDDIRQMVREDRDHVVGEIRSSSSADDPSREIVPDYHLLMVATNLDSWEADDPRFGHEVMLDVCYRQLDAPYYAWLRHRTENARRAHGAGALDDAAFSTIRERFNAIHAWAVQHIGEEALRHAIRTANLKSYVQPSEETYNAYRKTWDDVWNAHCRNLAACSNTAVPSDQAGKLERMLATRGYAVIKSAIIDDVVVVTRDDSVAVSVKWSGKVHFTMDELALLMGSSPETIKQVHRVKRTFGGEVVPTNESDSRLFPKNVPVVSDQQPRQLALECAI